MSYQEGNKGRQGRNLEERPAGNSGCMPGMRHQDVPYRQELVKAPAGSGSEAIRRLGIIKDAQPCFNGNISGISRFVNQRGNLFIQVGQEK